jgi:hypothetical protein
MNFWFQRQVRRLTANVPPPTNYARYAINILVLTKFRSITNAVCLFKIIKPHCTHTPASSAHGLHSKQPNSYNSAEGSVTKHENAASRHGCMFRCRSAVSSYMTFSSHMYIKDNHTHTSHNKTTTNDQQCHNPTCVCGCLRYDSSLFKDVNFLNKNGSEPPITTPF